MFQGLSAESGNATLRRRIILALREVLLIVVAVLIAIGLESQWQDSQDRGEERELLEALREEMEANSMELQRWINLHEMVRSSAANLLEAVRTVSPGTEFPVADTLISDIIRTPTYQPQLSVLETALSSGSIGLLRNVDLRRNLDGWSRGLEEAQEEERKGLQFVESQLVPHLHGAVDLEAAQESLVEFAEAHSAGRPVPPRSSSTSVLRTDSLLPNLLARRIFFAGFAMAELRVMQTSIDRIIEGIEQELR
jgi:hypothetical protein